MDLEDYCVINGIEMPTEEEIARVSTQIESSSELIKMSWPRNFLPLWDPRSEDGVKYLKSRKIEPADGLYYDVEGKSIVFAYYYDSTCVGAQHRFIAPREGQSKNITVPGTKISKLFFGWNQGDLPTHIKHIIVTEGAFNALAIQQALNRHYQSPLKNPYKAIAASGSSLNDYRSGVLAELVAEGYRVILAPDSDEAGAGMFEKAVESDCITHYSMVSQENKDWNDLLIDGDDVLKREFLGNLKRI
jgi:DNA primase